MSHIVVYESADGASGFERCGSLDAAIVAAERLRNVEGVTSPRIFRLEEVQFDFRPYFRVEVNGSESEADTAPVERAVIPEPPSMAAAPVIEPVADVEPVVEAEAVVAPEIEESMIEAEAVVEAEIEEPAAEAEATEDPFASTDDVSTDWISATDGDAPASDFEPEAELEAIFATDPEPVPENTGEALFDSLQDDAPAASDAGSIFDEVTDAADNVDPSSVVDMPEPDSMVSVRKGLFGR